MSWLKIENLAFLIALILLARGLWYLFNTGSTKGIKMPVNSLSSTDDNYLATGIKTSLDRTPGTVNDPFLNDTNPIMEAQMKKYFQYQYSLIAALIMFCIGVSLPMIKPYILAFITKTFFGD